MVVKITDIAKKAGVASSTVSNALTGKKYVSPELKEKILKICEELDYHPNFYASSLQSAKTNIIGLFLEQHENQELNNFYSELIMSCMYQASKEGYSLLIFYEADETKILSALSYGRAPIDGAIILSPTLKDERIVNLESNRIPCVVIGHPDRNLNLSFVDVDNHKLTYEITDILLKQYRKVYMINSRGNLTISHDRLKGFIDALATNDMTYTDDLVVHSRILDENEGFEFAIDKIESDVAFVTANELTAKGVCEAILHKGLNLGSDVGVFALGYSESENYMPKLSHAKQDYREIGSIAIQTLVKHIAEPEDIHNVYVSSKIVHKESSSKEK